MAPVRSSGGRSSASQAATPGPCRPTALSIPAPAGVHPGRRVAGPRERRPATSRRPRRAPARSKYGGQLGAVPGRARRRHDRVRQRRPSRPDVVRSTASADGPASPCVVSARRGTPAAGAPAARGAACSAMPWAAASAALDRGDAADPVDAGRLADCSPSARGPPCPCGRVDHEADLAAGDQVDGVDARRPRRPWRRPRSTGDAEAARGSRRCPSVAAMPRPSSRSRRATTSPAGLSRSASERNTVPLRRQHGAGRELGLGERQAEGRVDAHHLAGRAHLRAERGVDLGEAVERQHRLLDRDVAAGRPAARSRPSSRSSASVAPSITRAATLASGTPVALATNGTVRLARGLASMTNTWSCLAPRTGR